MTDAVSLPTGFTAHVANIGIKDSTTDFLVVASERPAAASAVFTRSRFAGPSVLLSRQHVADGRLQAALVVSKNANVATGAQGAANAAELAAGVGAALGCPPQDVLVTSTGVIGRQYPMERIRAHLATLSAPPYPVTEAVTAATAMMTTDTVAKFAEATVGAARIVGLAKGVGMIEPDMATMIALVFTDAEVAPADLDRSFRSVVERTFNSLSVDTDTSTSDTAAILANGAAGPVDLDAFTAGLDAVCRSLTRQLARDGEGATKLLVVQVDGARDDAQAKRVAKAIVNSPLVKTAVHGADPNWGRVAMAIGKCFDDTDIDQERVVIRFGEQQVYPGDVDEAGLERLSATMAAEEVTITAALAIADGSWTVYGCDLSDQYIRINADYTT
ncbi:MAG: bifunctional glutamate N-acetyltransferase/amino-acid acetyltransferase ArgJ [Acidimicrobiales bacterium]|nr:bifunctional glutamate N-acetyltransferase/amino-acid acetyltransferase ArgJ [Acidimicrobiales bacterium]